MEDRNKANIIKKKKFREDFDTHHWPFIARKPTDREARTANKERGKKVTREVIPASRAA
jgi:hypothetical protein